MIIITGAQRTGTSLGMQIHREAGFPIYGWKNSFHMRLADQNPEGFYEINRLTRVGITFANADIRPEHSKNHVLKVFGEVFPNCDSAFVDKVIVCVRRCEETIKSWTTLTAIDKTKLGNVSRKPSVNYFLQYYGLIKALAYRKCPFIVIDYNDWFSNPNDTLMKLFDFLGVGRFDLALKCIKPDLYRNHLENIQVPANEQKLVDFNNHMISKLKDRTIFDNMEILDVALGKIEARVPKREVNIAN